MCKQAQFSESEIDSYFEDQESEAWDRDCKSMVNAERGAIAYRAWLADDSHILERRI